MNIGAVDNTSNLMRAGSGGNLATEGSSIPSASNKEAATGSAAPTHLNSFSNALASQNNATSSSASSTSSSASATSGNDATTSTSQTASKDDTSKSSDGSKVPNADFSMFLKLLLAQVKNQDPTEPMDSTEYVAQLASFSAVEQQTQTNKLLKEEVLNKLDTVVTDGQVGRAEGYVGKYLKYTDDKGIVTEGTVESVSIYSDGLIARLDNGKDLIIGAGVTVMNGKPKSESANS